MKHKDIKILVRNFETEWEYLFVYDGEIYTFHTEIKPEEPERVLYSEGKLDRPYSDEQVKAILTMMFRLAETTIDTLTETAAVRYGKVE